MRKQASLPPLGLLTIGAMLPEALDKRLIDMNVTRLSDADLAWADLVFVSAMIAHRESVSVMLARCRAAGKTVVAGGPLFTSEHADFHNVDHFVLNEASINLADDEPLTRAIVAAGFDTVFIGIETPEEAGLAECNKRQNRGRITGGCGRFCGNSGRRKWRCGLIRSPAPHFSGPQCASA